MTKVKKEKIMKLIAPNIVKVGQVDIIKEACFYQLFADKLHILVLGDAGASAKSTFADSLAELYPGYSFFDSRGNISVPGVRDSLLENKRHSYTMAFFDEFPRMKADIMGIMFTLMQKQKLISNIAARSNPTGGKGVYIPVNVFATANPVGDMWTAYGDVASMRAQLPLGSAILRRFHLPICTGKYGYEGFGKLAKEYFKTDEFINFFQDHEDDYEDAKELIEDCRKIRVKVTLPSMGYDFIMKMKKFENELVFPISGELLAELKHMVIARARMDGVSETTDKHWFDVMNTYGKVIATHGLTDKLIRRIMKR
ncbi:MAG: hypothetical protein ACTSRU_17005 [Candidatus Hodarchaeales archaeon]